jgi:signal transduction histidine kinase
VRRPVDAGAGPLPYARAVALSRILTWGSPAAPSARPGDGAGEAGGDAPPRRINWWGELALTALLALVTVGGTAMVALHSDEETGPFGLAGLVLLSGAVAAVPLRRLNPDLALGMALAFTATYSGLGYSEGPLWFPLIVTFVHAVLSGRRRTAIVVLVTGWVAMPWLPAATGRADAPTLAEVLALTGWLAALLGAAEAVRYRREQAATAAASQAEALRRQVTEERLRIARDLHDVVAHSMSLINIQAGVALHLLDQHPEQARTSLSTIKQASKDALVELRSILGVLRQVDEAGDASEAGAGGGAGDGESAPRAPVPGLDRLGELIERARAAAVHVQVDEQPGASAGLPRPVDVAAFRILQESLTNVARHSHDRAPVIRLTRQDGGLLVEVLDEGVARARNEALPGAGHGVAGMRERAVSVGGWLEAGPRPGRGFLVRAWLPVSESPTPEPERTSARAADAAPTADRDPAGAVEDARPPR